MNSLLNCLMTVFPLCLHALSHLTTQAVTNSCGLHICLIQHLVVLWCFTSISNIGLVKLIVHVCLYINDNGFLSSKLLTSISSGGIFNILIVRFGCLLKTKYLSYVTTPFKGMIHVLWQFDLFFIFYFCFSHMGNFACR